MFGWNIDRGCAGTEMRERMEGELSRLVFPALEAFPYVRHAFSTRRGGASEGKFATMNFSFDKGDDPEHVRENYRRMARALGADPSSFAVARQTHTVNIREITEADRGAGVTCERTYRDVDGLMTDVPGITLVTFHADCIPIYLLDPVKRAVALLHAGWKGTADGIASRALTLLSRRYGSRPEDLVAGIGPGISRDAYEVGEDVMERFLASFPAEELPGLFDRPHRGADGRPRWQLDLKEANRRLLRRGGVREERLHVSGICTCRNAEHLFSHRAAGAARGLNAAFLGL